MTTADSSLTPSEQPLSSSTTATSSSTTSHPNFSHKHPLERQWTLYFDLPNKKQTVTNWMDSVKKLITFNTVEDFWGCDLPLGIGQND